jgi:DNA-binding MarR family transcriptional regulator
MSEWTTQGTVLCTSFGFRFASFFISSEDAAREEGLEPQQHQILLAIRAAGEPRGPTVGDLADQLLIRHHSAVGLVDRLAGHGLVERARDANDLRQVRIRLAAEGARKLRRLSAVHRAELRNSGPKLIKALQAAMKDVAAIA